MDQREGSDTTPQGGEQGDAVTVDTFVCPPEAPTRVTEDDRPTAGGWGSVPLKIFRRFPRVKVRSDDEETLADERPPDVGPGAERCARHHAVRR